MKNPQKKHKKGAKKRSFSVLLTLAIVIAVAYFAVSLIQLQVKIDRQEKAVAGVAQQIEEEKAENERLQRILDSGDEAAYIERVARDSLGYVMPDEKVYYDISAGK